ncbi:MAG: Gfo/Idh/MocA family protein [Planctomycetota bacterium]|jgi:predicted dehydrogenase
MQKTDRRGFLKTSAAAGASLAAAPAIAQSRASANDRIRVAICGIRGRGKSHVESIHAMASENVELAALCDCDASNLNGAAAAYEELSGKKATLLDDMRKMLDDDSIDAVSYATPNHWHALGVIWACQAGKDVYVEKPGSHNIAEGRKMVEAAAKHGSIVQHGTQCRSSPNIREGIAKLHNGVIGDVYMARGISYKLRGHLGNDVPSTVPDGLNWDAWVGPAPRQPFSNFRHRRWHWRWDFGNGDLGNQGVHQLDIIRWGMKLDSHPNRAQSMGGNFTHDDSAETAMVQNFACRFPDRNVMVTFEVRNWYTNSEAGFREEFPFVQPNFPVGTIFFGTEGYMILPDYSSYYTFLGPEREPGPSAEEEGHPIKDLEHFQNWIAAVRSRNRDDLNAEITEGHYSSALCHLANMAYRTGRALDFDPVAEKLVDDEEADALLTREPREPYAVPDEV